ncbi:FACE1 [Hepatospora eriocheir]|uniref:CAAX prenyl protease n=1 Tax=Hepatospora eriocheir TaxID=1081669 RepID=A0A1X0QCN1_9MICR|nr:FACE1 [Hepatospora eriocheir]
MWNLINYTVYPLAFNYVIGTLLKVLQFTAQVNPNPAKYLITDEEHKIATNYEMSKIKLSIVTEFFSFIKDLIMYQNIQQIYYRIPESKYFDKDVLMMLFISIFSVVFMIPFNLYSDFVLEESYGFNKKTLKLFIMDYIKVGIIFVVVAYPIQYLVFYLIRRFEKFCFYVGATIICIQGVFIYLHPILIAPLFNKFTPLDKELDLYKRIESLAKKFDYSIEKVNICDGSTRSSHSNAYFSGFGKSKRLVLFDTIVNQMSDDEIMGVVGHEFGHCVLQHIPKLITISSIYQFISLIFFNRFVYKTGSYPISIKMIVFSSYFSSFSILFVFLSNFISRKFEKEADMFSVELGFGEYLINGLKVLSNKNNVTLVNNWLYSLISFSHPPILERIEFIRKLIAKNK